MTSIGLGENVGGIIQNEFCGSSYSFEEFLSFGEGQYEAVMQVFVYDSATEDFLFINATNYELSTPEIVPNVVYPPNINALGDLTSGCNYRIENIAGECWGFKQESGGEWIQDTRMEAVKNAAFGETYDSGDLDNTCCDGEESIDIDSYPWYTTISKNRRTRGLMFSFNRGLVESVALLGCWGCSEYAAKIRDDFYTGDIRTLEWSSGSGFSTYVRRLSETDETLTDIEDKIRTWYWANDGLTDIFSDPSEFFSGIHQPNFGSWLNFGAAATLGGSQNLRVKVKNVMEDCSTNEVTCVIEVGVGDIFGAGKTDGRRWKFPGLISQFLLQHFRNDDCEDVPGSDLCFTPMVHWVNFTHVFTFQN